MSTDAPHSAAHLRQTVPALAATCADRAAITPVLYDIADLIQRTATVRRRLIDQLADDQDLYSDALRILLAPASPDADPVLDVLRDLTREVRSRQQSRHDTSYGPHGETDPSKDDRS